MRNGKTDLVIFFEPADSGEPTYAFWDEPNRPESVLARNAVENVLLKESQSKKVRSAPQSLRVAATQEIGRFVSRSE